MQDFARTAASLVQLVLLLVPLTSLVFGVLALTPDRGAAELLYAQPVSRGAILAGRCWACGRHSSRRELLGFGAAGLVVGQQAGTGRRLARSARSSCSAAALTAVFLAIAALLAERQRRPADAGAGRRARRLVRHRGALRRRRAGGGVDAPLGRGLAPADRGRARQSRWMPCGSARCVAIDGVAAFGAASLALFRVTGGPGLTVGLAAASLVAWLVGPLVLAMRRLNATDI